MDEYASWSFPTGKEAVLKSYERIDKVPKSENILLTDEEKNVTIENIDKNIVEVVEANPQIKFMFFITPYSIVYWDSCNQNNQVSKQIERERLLIEALVDYPNVEIYCFFNHEDLICDLDNYKDIAHYSADVNSQILNWIAEGKYQVTRADMEQHLEETKEFYENYNYDMIFEEN